MNTEKHVDTPLLLTTIAATLLLVAGCSDSGPSSGADAMDPAGNPSVSQESGQDAIETGEQEVTTDPDSAESGMTTQPVLMNTARYQLEFVSDWSAETHPVNFPPNPHFSGLVGAVHNEQVIFWQPGQLASDGVEVVAESGSKSTFLSEIENAVNDGTAKAAIDGSGITLSPGTTSVEFEVTRDYPLVSVLSMLAPSPDWIVGVDRLNLIEDGEFIGHNLER